MTATLDAPTPKRAESNGGRRERPVPDGSEAMSRPWRLGITGLGLALGLVTRLLIANGIGSLDGTTFVLAAAATSALVAVGLIAQAAERDRFGPSLTLLTGVTALSLGIVQWISPDFPAGTLEWETSSQLALAVLGTANGLLLAGIVSLALVRRLPTATVVGSLVAGLLTLIADTALLRNEWPSILLLAAAFGALLVAWDRAPRHEPAYRAAAEAPRISRAALGLASVAFCGAAIQMWISRGAGGASTSVGDDDVGTTTPAAILAMVLVLLTFAVLLRIRREIQRRQTTISEWTSWMREVRTRDLRSDFEDLATRDDGARLGDLTTPPPTLSFPDLRVDDEVSVFDTPTFDTPTFDMPDPLPAPAAVADPLSTGLAAARQDSLFDDLPSASFDELWAQAGDDEESDARVAAVVGRDQGSLFDSDGWEWTIPEDLPEPPEPENVAPSQPSPAAAGQPALADTASAWGQSSQDERARIIWADEPAEAPDVPPQIAVPSALPATPEPTPDGDSADGQPVVVSLRAAREAQRSSPTAPSTGPPPADADDARPERRRTAGAFGAHAAPSRPAPRSAPVDTSSGAFTSWLGAPTAAATGATGSADDLEAWLARTADRPARLIAAVEAMSLADLDELPPEVSAATVRALAGILAAAAPTPDLVAHIDGPYLMVAWPDVERTSFPRINRTLLDVLAEPVQTTEGLVGLTGTLALLQLGGSTTVADVIDEAIVGLVQARRLELLARGA